MYKRKKRIPQPRDSQAVSRKTRLYQNQYTNAEYQQTGAKLKYAENFRFCQKKHYYLRTFCACQGSPYMLHCTGTIVLQGG